MDSFKSNVRREKVLELNQLLLEFTTSGLKLQDWELDAEINKLLGQISEVCDNIDRSYVFLYDENEQLKTMSNTHEWCAEGVAPAISNLQGLPCDIAPWWMKKLNNHENIVLSSLGDLPQEAIHERALLEPQGVQSLLIVPVFFRDVLRGFVGFDSVASTRIWTVHEQFVLSAFAAALAMLLDRRNTTQQLQASEARLRFVVENLGGAVFSADPIGVFTLVKGRMSHVLQNTDGSSAALTEVFASVPAVNDAFKTVLEGKPCSVSFPFKEYFIELDMAPIFENMQLKGIVGMLSDLTEHESARNQLVLSARWASIGVLAAGIAHEINNPMAIVLGYNGILESKLKLLPNPEQLLGFLDKQNNAVQRVARIIEGLRTFADGFNEPLSLVDLNEIVKAALPLCAALFDKGTAVLEVETLADKIWIHANQTQIQHVLMTLLTNAYDAVAHCARAVVLLKTRIEGDEAVIIVKDNGTGIESANLERIFDPFFTTKEAGKGSGLGLFVANSLLQQMHGYFKVESTLGEGSSFFVRLPNVPAPQISNG